MAGGTIGASLSISGVTPPFCTLRMKRLRLSAVPGVSAASNFSNPRARFFSGLILSRPFEYLVFALKDSQRKGDLIFFLIEGFQSRRCHCVIPHSQCEFEEICTTNFCPKI